MKELSIEQKAKAYDEALEKARCYYEGANGNEDMITMTTTMFPELKESEDERIRKELLLDIPKVFPHDKAFRYIAYLEKQGEQKPVDKVEPKFKAGDWVIFNNNNSKDSVYKIEKAENYQYTLRHILGGSMPLPYSSEDMLRLWTIQDAKDGDVLATNDWVFIFKELNTNEKPVCYCHYDIELGFRIDTNSYIATGSEIYPATKEQREQLEKAMANAGYKWDAEKKELKKIEHNAWSEEDEQYLEDTLNLLEGHRSKNTYGDVVEWLKSIKNRVQPQSQWKPSDSQMELLDSICASNYLTTTNTRVLQELYDALKKLREE